MLRLLDDVIEQNKSGKRQTRVVVYPELCVTGYTCHDLFNQHTLIKRAYDEMLRFAKLSNKNEVIKENGNHVYENDVEFSGYYELYKSEREKYPTISKNIISFETIFKSIFSYRILTMYTLESKDNVIGFLDVVRIRIPNNNHYSDERIHHMNKHIDEIKDNINNYHDVYCFFDRMSLGC